MTEPGADAREARVLIVDDVPEITATLARMIQRGHFRATVVQATRPEEAMRALETGPFDVVVSDYRMPGATGLDVLASARRLCPDAHRILMSAYAELPESAERLHAASPDALLPKPFDMGEAILMLSDFLHAKESAIAAHRAHVRTVLERAE